MFEQLQYFPYLWVHHNKVINQLCLRCNV